MTYKYITKNNLQDRQNYMYSEYGGKEFLNAYQGSRETFIVSIQGKREPGGGKTISADGKDGVVSYERLRTLKNEMQRQLFGEEQKGLMDAFVKTFEVRKRIYSEYTDLWKPAEKAGFENYEIYLLMAECLVMAYHRGKCTKYFSCLLKVNDTLLSVGENMTDRQKRLLAGILEEELKIYQEVAGKAGCGEVVS